MPMPWYSVHGGSCVCHGVPYTFMTVPWRAMENHGNAMACHDDMPWTCHGGPWGCECGPWQMPWPHHKQSCRTHGICRGKCHGSAIALLWRAAMTFCDGNATATSCPRYGPSWCAIIHDIAMAIPWHALTRHGNSVVIHGNAMVAQGNDVQMPSYAIKNSHNNVDPWGA